MAMGHTVGRSAMGMGEGETLWSGWNPPSVRLREIERIVHSDLHNNRDRCFKRSEVLKPEIHKI